MVPQRPAEGPRLRVDVLGHREGRKLDRRQALAAPEDVEVGRMDVADVDPVAVAKSHREQQLLEEEAGRRYGQAGAGTPRSAHQRVQAPAVAVLRDDVKKGVGAPDGLELYDVRVVEGAALQGAASDPAVPACTHALNGRAVLWHEAGACGLG